MTTTKIKNCFLLLFTSIMLTTTSIINAQSNPLVPANSTMIIHGTSNVHDWDMKVTKITGDLSVNEARQINSLLVQIPVSSIKSGKGIMDKKTYDCFDAKKNPNIVFRLTETTAAKLTDTDSDIILTGNLSMAGVTKKISFKAKGKLNKAGNYQIKGDVPLKMTDYKMIPPVAMLGAMKTGNDVVVKFDVAF